MPRYKILSVERERRSPDLQLQHPNRDATPFPCLADLLVFSLLHVVVRLKWNHPDSLIEFHTLKPVYSFELA